VSSRRRIGAKIAPRNFAEPRATPAQAKLALIRAPRPDARARAYRERPERAKSSSRSSTPGFGR
jgi:hypothetical protein